MKLYKLTIREDTTVEQYGVVYAGEYHVEMPDEYDASLVTATDMVTDPAMRTIEDKE